MGIGLKDSSYSAIQLDHHWQPLDCWIRRLSAVVLLAIDDRVRLRELEDDRGVDPSPGFAVVSVRKGERPPRLRRPKQQMIGAQVVAAAQTKSSPPANLTSAPKPPRLLHQSYVAHRKPSSPDQPPATAKVQTSYHEATRA